MRFGYCVNANFLLAGDPRGREIFEGVLAAGYDYIETQLSRLLELPPAQYGGFKKRLADAGAPCRAGMMLFPYTMPLVGHGRDLRAVGEHAKRTLHLAADLGCEVAVFGHGDTRRVPGGMDYETARRRLADVLRLLGSLAAPYGMKIAVEPLCDTDMIVSYPEAAALAGECGDGVGAVFDLYHAAALGQAPADILLSPEKLFHLHIACPGGRTAPAETDDGSAYAAFAAAAKRCGYDNTLSVEAGIPDGAHAAEAAADALGVIRRYFS
ncbi:MAG: sugar phosphate isomerase/epimerase [Oscillospiraceae bacterium]|jgi:sugar phosphate isomerase/epimerase|nr:sugar phosphate isomerase/epimerase [Oscillospiraceae bacterium]